MKIPELYELFLASKGICTDSRKTSVGSIFFALKGENFNGNEHAIGALEKGCSYAVVDEDIVDAKAERLIGVSNVLEALQALAQHHRKVVNPYVIGITGSNGKTTTKELLLAVLGQTKRTHATVGNFNNHIGVPLTLLSMPIDTEVAIIEMGANHIGEIAALSRICDPDLGIITNIGKAHLEGFGSFEGVKKAKGELFELIRKNGGVLLVCSDNDLLMEMSSGIERTTYGSKNNSDLIGRCINEVPFLKIEWKSAILSENNLLETQLSGLHNLENILCAICAGVKLEVPAELINNAISTHIPSDNRSQWVNTENNSIFLDAYNANPSSMELAIRNFVKLQESDQLLILGDMKELGDTSKEEHKKILKLVEKYGKDVIYVGPEFENVVASEWHYRDTEELRSALKADPIKGKQILIKGSRGIALEKVLDLL